MASSTDAQIVKAWYTLKEIGDTPSVRAVRRLCGCTEDRVKAALTSASIDYDTKAAKKRRAGFNKLTAFK